jgi:hypothetical protein
VEVNMMELNARWLQTLDPDRLATVLARRPEASRPAPASLADLAERLRDPDTILPALRRLDRPTVQVCEAIVALGGDTTRAELYRLLGAVDAGTRAAVDAAIDRLTEAALALAEVGGRLHLPVAVGRAWARPLGLGPPVATIIEHTNVDTLKRAGSRLGVTGQSCRANLVPLLIAALGDGDRVRSIVDGSPLPVSTLLRRLAATGESVHVSGLFPGPGNELDPFEWSVARALLLRASAWGDTWLMPAEVGLALRGRDYVAPFEPRPPLCPRAEADGTTVQRDAAAAAGNLLRLATAVLDDASRVPVATLRTFGVGIRELKRLAKAHGVSPDEVKLVLALSTQAKLLAPSAGTMTPTAEYDDWLELEPAERLNRLIQAWWAMPYAALSRPEEAWTPMPVDGVEDLRAAILDMIAEEPGAIVDPHHLIEGVLWRRPYAVLLPPESYAAAFLASWVEAAALGLIGTGAISAAGRALVAGDGAALASALATIGPVVRTAHLQTDLTAVVPGTPAPPLAELLDATADRESSATAATWRFSPGSVRRALDAGHTADGLLADLKEIATTAVPQTLEYLVRDVARRHGAVRAGAAGCVLRGEDASLLAELVADKRLRALELRLVTANVLASMASLSETLAALRRAGYAPVAEAADGTAVVEQPARHRTRPTRVLEHTSGPRALAARHRAGDTLVTPTPGARKLATALLDKPGPLVDSPIRDLYPLYQLDRPVVEEPPPPRRPPFARGRRRW